MTTLRLARGGQVQRVATSPGFLRRFGRMVASRLGIQASGSVYENAGEGRRWVGLQSPGTGPTASLVSSNESLRNRSHALLRNNAYAFSGRETFVANIVGTGIVPHPQHGDDAFRTYLKARFAAWTDKADADGLTDFYGQTSLAVGGMFESGECFGRLRNRLRSDGLEVPLQVQILEAEMVPLWKNETLPDGYIRAGLEFDKIGRRRAVWMYREHPGEMSSLTARSLELVRVPASEVLHLFRPLRPGQLRGEPWLARVILRLADLARYSDAEVVRKSAAAMIAFVLELPDPEKATEIVSQLHDQAAEANGGATIMEPGSVPVLGPGEHMETLSPADVGANFNAFFEQTLREIAAGIGIPYEMLTGDLSKVNYSSIRAGTLEFWRRCDAVTHHDVVFKWCRPIWDRWLDQAAFAGVIPADEYLDNKEAFRACVWVPPGRQWVDPESEVKAALLEIEGGLTSRSRVVASKGDDVAEIDRERAADNAREAALGIERAAIDKSELKTPSTTKAAPAPPRTGTNG